MCESVDYINLSEDKSIRGVALAGNSCRSFQNFAFFKNQMDKFVRNIFNIKMLGYYWSILQGGVRLEPKRFVSFKEYD
jgi:hypothetical protein